MFRLDATKVILERVGDGPIVSNLGPTSNELWHAGHRARNFYTHGAMGLCSSIALGIALSTQEKVVSLDGDGSLLMNMGTIATIGREKPPNLIVVVWDNEEWGQTGHQPQPHRHGHQPGAGSPGLWNSKDGPPFPPRRIWIPSLRRLSGRRGPGLSWPKSRNRKNYLSHP